MSVPSTRTIPDAPATGLAYTSSRGRWVIAATVLGSSVAMLDATVVNVALPALGRDLQAGVDGLQWTVTGYALTLSALILLGGALGDRLGRRRMFVLGVAWFAAASLLCGLAPNLTLLIVARMLQGIGGALLTPGSLAILQASFTPEDSPLAIAAWSGLGGVATAVGPFVGGWLIETVSWRLIFLINLPIAAAVILIAQRWVPESFDPHRSGRIDLLGSLLTVLTLGGVSYALIEAPAVGGLSPTVLFAGGVGLLSLAAFIAVEMHNADPMLPLELFRSRTFSGANLVTLAVYGALSGVFFLLVLQLQQVVGYTPLQAGIATLPVTVLMLVLSPRAGRIGQRIGPRVPLSVGPWVAAVGIALMARIGPGASYVLDVLPPIVIFGLGMTLMVAPLTATVMGSVDARYVGVASAVNNAVARAAGLIAVALLPPLAGLSGAAYLDPSAFDAGFVRGVLLAAGLATCGGVSGWLSLTDAPRASS